MTEKQAKDMKDLVTEINRASRLYYVDGTSDLSDNQWDSLYRKLECLENKLGIKYRCSPTRNVGIPPNDSFTEQDIINIEE